jgi:hypothetical protein
MSMDTTLVVSPPWTARRPAASRAAGRETPLLSRLRRRRRTELILATAELTSQRLDRFEATFIAGLRGF